MVYFVARDLEEKVGFGKSKIVPSFIKKFLNQNVRLIDFRIENFTLIEQISNIKFDLQNNSINLEKPKNAGEVLNSLHAISIFYDLSLPLVLQDGYVENGVVFDLQEKKQNLPTPKINFEKINNCNNFLYLDHPDRVHMDVVFGSHTDRTKIDLRLWEGEKYITKKQFEKFNEGTDFLIYNYKCNNLEDFLEGYVKGVHTKTANIIAQKNGHFKSYQDVKHKDLTLEQCLKVIQKEVELYGLYWEIEELFPNLPEEKVEIKSHYKKILDQNIVKDKDVFSYLFAKTNENIYDYCYRMWDLFERDEDWAYFIVKQTNELGEIDTFKTTFVPKNLENKIVKEVFNIYQEDKELMRQKLLVEKLKQGFNLDIETIQECISNSLHLAQIEYLFPKSFEVLKKKKYEFLVSKWARNVSKNFSVDDYGSFCVYALDKLGFDFEKIIDILGEKRVRKEADYAINSIYAYDYRGDKLNPPSILKYLNRIQTKKNIKIELDNNKETHQRIYFKAEDIISSFENASYFIVPTTVYFFKNKQFERFKNEFEAFHVPLYINNSFVFLYDTKRSRTLRNNFIPEKFRNEFLLNNSSKGRHAIGQHYNHPLTQKGFFADFQFI
jgi:hypothetical protein